MKVDTYYFSNNKKIEFIYNVDIIKNNIKYTKLSKDFNTNVIQKVFKR